MELKWKNIPNGWALCYNKECVKHERCLHWYAGQLNPQEETIVRYVMPYALKNGICPHFASTEIVTYARGFSKIYDQVLKTDYTPLRKEMTTMLSGKRYYYEYMRGKRRLSPEQQEKIRDLFAKYGYADSVHFDSFEQDYYFNEI